MGLLDTLFGSAPSVSSKTKFTPQQLVGDIQNTYAPLIQQTGQGLAQQVFGNAASFGPGFQGTISDAFARAQVSNLLQFLNFAANARSLGTEFVTNPGSAGLIPSFVGGLSGGLGGALGAKLLGIGGGGGIVSPQSSFMANAGILPGQSGRPTYY